MCFPFQGFTFTFNLLSFTFPFARDFINTLLVEAQLAALMANTRSRIVFNRAWVKARLPSSNP